MLTKMDAVNLVSAMPESSFERIEGIELIQAPSKFDKGFGIAVTVICLVPMAIIAIGMTAEIGKAVFETCSEKWQARKAKKAAEAAAKQS